MNDSNSSSGEVSFKNRFHLITVIVFNAVVWPLLVGDLILLLYHTEYNPIIAFVIISLLVVFLDYYMIFYLGEYTPKRIWFKKNSITLDFISPFQNDKKIKRRKETKIIIERHWQMWPFRRYHAAIIDPPNIHFLNDIPRDVVDHFDDHWKTDHNLEKRSWRFETFAGRMVKKYPELKR